MQKPLIKPTTAGAKRMWTALLFCIACLTLNAVIARVVVAFGLPLYMDCIGTILAGAIGGVVPGVIVGFLTNMLLGVFDASAWCYAITGVLIGITASEFGKRGWFDHPGKSLLSVPVFALIGGGLGSIITWFLYGFGFSEGIAAPLVQSIYATGHVNELFAQLIGDCALDLVDKLIAVIIVFVCKKALGRAGIHTISFELWMQAPLSSEQIREVENTSPRVVSIRTKIGIAIVAIILNTVMATTWISYTMFDGSIVEEQTYYAFGIADLAAQALDPARVDDYLRLGEQAEGYAETEAEFARIRDTFSAVRYVYAYRILEDGCHVVLDPDQPGERGSDTGEVIPFDDAFLVHRDTLLAGKPLEEAVISNGQYGWLLTVYMPIYDDQGVCQCYVAADISMDHVIMDTYKFLARVVTLFCAFFIFVYTIIVWISKYSLVLPINTLAHTNSSLEYKDDTSRAKTIEAIRSLDICTGDEIENLYAAMLNTTQETAHFIDEVEDQQETIARMQNNLIVVMADLVESRDQFTGDHIRKTTAYVSLIVEEMRREGIYADQLTDKFVSDVKDSAPLHDLGKIAIPDNILNKPGRLTAEEFEVMKSHTTVGREILERAVSAVSEPTYLDMAKDIAEFHHEKWNGQGYPCGLAGEDIPLCARIMAVADVFDALVSKRSYKDGFPLDKAFGIIEESVGSHFDPQVARAFLNVRDEAARIAYEHGDVAHL